MAAHHQPPHADGPTVVDRDVWLACAIPLSRLPAVGAQAYYFPHGHAEQCPDHLPAPLPAPHLFPCTVTAVRLAADHKTNEVLAEISLQPGPHRGPPPPPAPDAAGAADANLSFFAKQLTQSDANNGGGFSVPRYCADHIFPKLRFEDDPPVQNLLMRDPLGRRWQFRHIYRGTPRRHLLTTGWSKFVNAKLLVAGDTVVFMRRPDGELLVGLRRAPRYPAATPPAAADDPPPRNVRARVPPGDVAEAARLAAEGSPFTVTYFPRQGAAEFVVPRREVEDALASRWEPGTQLRMQVMEAEDARRTEWANGTLNKLHPNIWRALEVRTHIYINLYNGMGNLHRVPPTRGGKIDFVGHRHRLLTEIYSTRRRRFCADRLGRLLPILTNQEQIRKRLAGPVCFIPSSAQEAEDLRHNATSGPWRCLFLLLGCCSTDGTGGKPGHGYTVAFTTNSCCWQWHATVGFTTNSCCWQWHAGSQA
jgi:hypothetical protein